MPTIDSKTLLTGEKKYVYELETACQGYLTVKA
ncbi:hypothetical protein Riv7116_5532 [Rivularia sp. PCC 7116]|nr:hypothetical protein Riv7116_5532 [Rivularia sp. PCC 7116]